MTQESAPAKGALGIVAAKRDRRARYRVDWLRAYPEARRERWDRDDRARYEARLAALESQVARLRAAS